MGCARKDHYKDLRHWLLQQQNGTLAYWNQFLWSGRSSRLAGDSLTEITMKKIRVIVACEESQAVCKAFRERGFEAFSCDIEPCSGGHPEWHFQEDIFTVLRREPTFDLMIAHPPCTFLSNAGACRLSTRWVAHLRSLK